MDPIAKLREQGLDVGHHVAQKVRAGKEGFSEVYKITDVTPSTDGTAGSAKVDLRRDVDEHTVQRKQLLLKDLLQQWQPCDPQNEVKSHPG